MTATKAGRAAFAERKQQRHTYNCECDQCSNCEPSYIAIDVSPPETLSHEHCGGDPLAAFDEPLTKRLARSACYMCIVAVLLWWVDSLARLFAGM